LGDYIKFKDNYANTIFKIIREDHNTFYYEVITIYNNKWGNNPHDPKIDMHIHYTSALIDIKQIQFKEYLSQVLNETTDKE